MLSIRALHIQYLRISNERNFASRGDRCQAQCVPAGYHGFIAFMQAINAFMQTVNAFMQTVNAFMQATSSLRPPRTVLMLTGERLCQNSTKHALFIHCVIVINQDSIHFHQLDHSRSPKIAYGLPRMPFANSSPCAESAKIISSVCVAPPLTQSQRRLDMTYVVCTLITLIFDESATLRL